MLKQAKIKLKSLIYDDSGVAMAYTIMVFLFFFMLCVSTYAMTENIRQKIELQNACDAAAYSGAVVQADMLSRIAVLNRALSWTYLQTNRRQMDYLVGEFAIAAKADHTIQSAWVLANNFGCPLHWISGVNYYACSRSSGNYHIKMMSHHEPAGSVGTRGNVSQLLGDIDTGKNNLTKIKNAMTEIKAVMNECIENACKSSFYSAVDNSDISMIADLGKVDNYLIDEKNEANFLAFSKHTKNDMKAGVDNWWVEVSSGSKIQRRYNNGLKWSFYRHYEKWECDPETGCKRLVNFKDNWDPSFNTSYNSPEVIAIKLSKSFFGQQGTITISAKRKMQNPFTGIFNYDAADGMYGAFNGNKTDMWAISTARAGIRFNNDPTGYYRVHYPGETAEAKHGYTNGVWNLCEDDWDAVMIPVSRAWNETSSSGWSGNRSSQNLLTKMKSELGVNNSYSTGIDSNNGGLTGGFMRH